MMNRLLAYLILLLTGCSLLSSLSMAGTVPNLLSYQGFVTDNSGTPIGNTNPVNRTMQFRLYDAATGGTALYAEEQTVTISGGNFSVLIGNGSGISGSNGPSAPANTPYLTLSEVLVGDGTAFYLGVTVDDGDSSTVDAEIAPRQQFVSAAFALRAMEAEKVASGAITNSMIGNEEINTNNLAGNSVTTAKIVSGAVTSSEILDASIGTIDLANSSITAAKIDTATVGLWDVAAGDVYRPNGYVGVGTIPSAPLHLIGDGNTSVLRMDTRAGRSFSALLPENSNNEAPMVFQTNNSWAFDIDGQRILQLASNGLVGIQTNNPLDALHVVGNARIEASSAPVLTLTDGGSRVGYLGLATSAGTWSNDAGAGDLVIGGNGSVRLASGTGKSLITVKNDNRVQFGTEIYSSHGFDTNGNIISGNDSYRIYLEYPNGSDSGQMVIETRDNGNEKIIFRQNNRESMRINESGRLMVGTTSLNEAVLNVGAVSATYRSFGRLNSNGANKDNKTYTNPMAISADGVIFATRFDVKSDARIKQVKGLSDGSQDLQTIASIEITDYTYIDPVTNGSAAQKKVIAQQVEEIFPQAVQQQKGVIPDIFQIAPVSAGWIICANTLTAGETIKILHESGSGLYTVLEANSHALRVDFPDIPEEVFIYGRQVNDLRSVDYDALSSLNISATQELYKKVQSLETRMAHLEATIEASKHR